MKIYGLGGLGVDERVFSAINSFLEKPITPIKWIAPHQKETLQEYAARMATLIPSQEEISIIGVSFGGMVAIEVSKLIKVKKLILISSAASKFEIPRALRLIGLSGLFQIIPEKYINPPFPLTKWYFSVKTQASILLLKGIINETDTKFTKWAINAMAAWQNVAIPENLIRIHGQKDRLLPPIKNISYRVVKNGGHFAVIEDAKEIASILNNEFR
jgi:pimeloyl-ACP methyl ester carboxylesterase